MTGDGINLLEELTVMRYLLSEDFETRRICTFRLQHGFGVDLGVGWVVG